MTHDEQLERDWARYALTRIRALVDKRREDMSDTDFSIYTFASSALVGGDPVIALLARGPGQLSSHYVSGRSRNRNSSRRSATATAIKSTMTR